MSDLKAEFEIIIQDIFKTKLMQSTDLFEESKVVAVKHSLVISFEESRYPITFANCQNIIQKTVAGYKNDKEKIIFMHLFFIQNKNEVLLNKNKLKPYIDKSVRVISDGSKWFVFADYLKAIGIEITTDQNKFIIS